MLSSLQTQKYFMIFACPITLCPGSLSIQYAYCNHPLSLPAAKPFLGQ